MALDISARVSHLWEQGLSLTLIAARKTMDQTWLDCKEGERSGGVHPFTTFIFSSLGCCLLEKMIKIKGQIDNEKGEEGEERKKEEKREGHL